MISKYPANDEDMENAEFLQELLASDWQMEALTLNPDYLGWGVHEDYMMGESKYPHSWSNPVIMENWKEFSSSWTLNDLNECVNFYFSVRRESKNCPDCEGNGSNPETKKIYDTFYGIYAPSFSSPLGVKKIGEGWSKSLTQDEVDHLWEKGRFFFLHGLKEKPTVEEANRYEHHDSINHWTLTEQRAKRLGVWGLCSTCEGKGYIFTENTCHLQLTLWMLVPRKGCSRGVEIKHLDKEDLLPALEFLAKAEERNKNRFKKAVNRYINTLVDQERGEYYARREEEERVEEE